MSKTETTVRIICLSDYTEETFVYQNKNNIDAKAQAKIDFVAKHPQHEISPLKITIEKHTK